MPLSFLLSAQISDVFVIRRPLLSFFSFQGLVHTVENAVCFRVVAFLTLLLFAVAVVSLTLVLVVVVVVVVVIVVVNAILLADAIVLFPHVPVLTPTATLAVVALFHS